MTSPIISVTPRVAVYRAMRFELGVTTADELRNFADPIRINVGVSENDPRDIRWVVIPRYGDVRDGDWLLHCDNPPQLRVVSDETFRLDYSPADGAAAVHIRDTSPKRLADDRRHTELAASLNVTRV